jgi:transcriptional regulator with XRE-family HTH domain
MSTFGERLRRTIEVHHLMTLTDFANKTGISLQNVSHYVHGQRKPGLDTLVDMIGALPKTHIGWLITGNDK